MTTAIVVPVNVPLSIYSPSKCRLLCRSSTPPSLAGGGEGRGDTADSQEMKAMFKVELSASGDLGSWKKTQDNVLVLFMKR